MKPQNPYRHKTMIQTFFDPLKKKKKTSFLIYLLKLQKNGGQHGGYFYADVQFQIQNLFWI